MKTVFVTGGSGFIGRNFIEYAQNKYKLLYPSHFQLNLLDTKQVDNFFRKHKIDVVLHCANVGGQRNNKNSSSISINLRIFFNIIRNKNKFKKMIHFGSGAEYDKSRNIKKIKESEFDKRIPIDEYGLSKYICSKYIEKSSDIFCLRLFGVFGKGEDITVRFISQMLLNYIHKQPLSIIQNAYFDYIDVADVCRIVDRFIRKSPKSKFINIGSGKRLELLEIAKQINKLDLYSLKVNLKKSGLNREYTCNNKELLREIPHFKFTPFQTSLENLYLYYKKKE